MSAARSFVPETPQSDCWTDAQPPTPPTGSVSFLRAPTPLGNLSTVAQLGTRAAATSSPLSADDSEMAQSCSPASADANEEGVPTTAAQVADHVYPITIALAAPPKTPAVLGARDASATTGTQHDHEATVCAPMAAAETLAAATPSKLIPSATQVATPSSQAGTTVQLSRSAGSSTLVDNSGAVGEAEEVPSVSSLPNAPPNTPAVPAASYDEAPAQPVSGYAMLPQGAEAAANLLVAATPSKLIPSAALLHSPSSMIASPPPGPALLAVLDGDSAQLANPISPEVVPPESGASAQPPSPSPDAAQWSSLPTPTSVPRAFVACKDGMNSSSRLPNIAATPDTSPATGPAPASSMTSHAGVTAASPAHSHLSLMFSPGQPGALGAAAGGQAHDTRALGRLDVSGLILGFTSDEDGLSPGALSCERSSSPCSGSQLSLADLAATPLQPSTPDSPARLSGHGYGCDEVASPGQLSLSFSPPVAVRSDGGASCSDSGSEEGDDGRSPSADTMGDSTPGCSTPGLSGESHAELLYLRCSVLRNRCPWLSVWDDDATDAGLVFCQPQDCRDISCSYLVILTDGR